MSLQYQNSQFHQIVFDDRKKEILVKLSLPRILIKIDQEEKCLIISLVIKEI
ncbi:Hypothetical protein Minf_1086 [Methylacidiphilum infernorum V4]|uniref:Uncharacterized protein n=1 Tax=Methylacidiphilum infernorum (isolate V4) TaxID=481448 RepID=B3DUY8_METI4|nr:Hypothetical protein Minf_1086 [Methylacidiphilum infernorum V4]